MKKELRSKVIDERVKQSQTEVEEKSAAITSKLMNLSMFSEAKTIMLYLDFRKEVSTKLLIKKCLEKHKRIVVPVTDFKNKRLIPSEIRNYPDDLIVNHYGILEPKECSIRPVDAKEVDLFIVPGVAFDVKGNRLGYGGGFYDRFLPQARKDSVYIALAFELQIKDNVFPEEHDIPVHFIITESRVINTGGHN